MDDIMTTGQQWAAAEGSGDAETLAGLVTDDFRVVGQFRVVHVFVRPADRWLIANVQYSTIGGPPPFQR
jgi:ketosteroid isomerase-like protein